MTFLGIGRRAPNKSLEIVRPRRSGNEIDGEFTMESGKRHEFPGFECVETRKSYPL